ncbi:hypothetical protein Y09_0514 [Brachybacterium sp. SW0106-09]|nr:hypothetical protein Y09_0514 [Brachybacterium sp. SW0106-09]
MGEAPLPRVRVIGVGHRRLGGGVRPGHAGEVEDVLSPGVRGVSRGRHPVRVPSPIAVRGCPG